MIFVSIVGDSISTYEGYNPPEYAVYYDKEMQQVNGLNSVYDTWWAKVNQRTHAYLCVNNSYSGSKVTGNGFPAASSIERISRLKTASSSPDYILVYIGVNDFGNGVKIRQDRVTNPGNNNLLYFEDAYEYMISQIQEQYTDAKIICGTLLRSKVKRHEDWIFPESYAGVRFEDYNDAIRRITKQKNILLADIAKQNIRYETLDGTHPTAEGHKTIAHAWIKCLMEREGVQGQNYETIQR